MKPHEERVVTEKRELDEKIAKLNAFYANPVFKELPFGDRTLLLDQCSVMEQYSKILEARIARFPKE
jgi:hypothetical protein